MKFLQELENLQEFQMLENLYLYGSYNGNSDLDQTKNYEIDLGFDKTIGNF
jgi:hypothetical protein